MLSLISSTPRALYIHFSEVYQQLTNRYHPPSTLSFSLSPSLIRQKLTLIRTSRFSSFFLSPRHPKNFFLVFLPPSSLFAFYSRSSIFLQHPPSISTFRKIFNHRMKGFQTHSSIPSFFCPIASRSRIADGPKSVLPVSH